MNLFALKTSLPAFALIGTAAFLVQNPHALSKTSNSPEDLPLTPSTRVTSHQQAPASSKLSDSELLAHFPKKDPNSGITIAFTLPHAKNQNRFLQRELGRRFQERAIDIIVDHKGGQHFSVGLMTGVGQAIIGWMEVDREGALTAMAQLFPPDTNSILAWKGKVNLLPG